MSSALGRGTTIGGYIALHSGLDSAYIKGSLSIGTTLTTVGAITCGAGMSVVGRIDLNSSSSGAGTNRGISFWSPSFVTWVEYMSTTGAGLACTGGTAPTYGDVTSYARRSTIESNAGYGWIWDSCVNTAATNPDPKMALSSNTGNLRIKGEFTATKVWGAVYNDYAEFRQSKQQIKYGTVAIENGDGHIIPCNRRLAPTAMIVSDTHGFGIGKQEIEGEYSLPVAVAGRVLAYTDRDRDAFKVGDAVCSGKNGTVSKMNWLEKIIHPDKILGVVSEVPTYEEWGTDKIKVDGRIWIKIT